MQKRGRHAGRRAPVPRGTVDVAKAVDVIAAAQPQAVMLIAQAKPNAAFIKAYKAKGASAQFLVLSVSSGLHAELKSRPPASSSRRSCLTPSPNWATPP